MSRPRITKAELEKIRRRNLELDQDALFPGGGSDMSDSATAEVEGDVTE